MNVFEDLIEELKEENLLEETVIDVGRKTAVNTTVPTPADVPAAANGFVPAGFDAGPAPGTLFASPSPAAFSGQVLPEPSFPEAVFSSEGVPAPPSPAPQIVPPAVPVNPSPVRETVSVPAARRSFERPAGHAPKYGEAVRSASPRKEFFKRRAIDEVTGLQMVDHVLSGVEREQMKMAPKPFDDIPVKKALHDFMQVSAETGTQDHARAEFQLMQETESWYSSLSHRDRYISVAHLRRYCETTKPALSPQALIAMGRFYRNSPFSEQVRNKFDLIMTRLFTKETENDKRELLFEPGELALQIKDLYADWQSIQVYSAEEDDSEILIAVLKIEDFVTEAESTESFDELIANDFFNRLRLFKESLAENFFAPMITIASIEANVRIGNRYVDLIERERRTANAPLLEEKYGFLHDQAISDSTAKTLQLVELLQERVAVPGKEAELVEIHVDATQPAPAPAPAASKPASRFAVNKWLIALMVVTVLVCGGLYLWAESNTRELAGTLSPKVKKVNLDNSSMKEYLQAARINEETLYGITTANWDELALEKKEEILKKLLLIGPDKGFSKVQLLNEKGKSVGYAAADMLEVYNPQ